MVIQRETPPPQSRKEEPHGRGLGTKRPPNRKIALTSLEKNPNLNLARAPSLVSRAESVKPTEGAGEAEKGIPVRDQAPIVRV